jgi:hypothetical protein
MASLNKAGRQHGGPRGVSRPTPTRKAMLMTVQQGEAESGIPYTTLLDQIHRGYLPCVRLPGSRRIWIKRDDLVHLIEQSVERAG